ncbi:ribonuclease HI [Arcobacter ellisii]|uniref:ribonuclease H n=1 Tax=Arcobacter ellisii TaxID=913109 RepID=A0A347U9I4_9BACT|nr:ribonuclease H family protein [Arcobacter ellisii]AXX95512.1 ribonuclease HI [Arcobacter ellisii]RXI31612.1 ribonuclease HI [Arcobacter ellisii]
MKIEENFLDLISHNNNLNQEQFKILGLVPESEDWKELALEKEVSKNDMNLLMLLKGNFSHKAQEQIIKNYHMVLEFNSIKAKVYSPKKEEIKIENEVNEEEEHIKIYCDGACSGNPGNAGSGLAIYSNKKNPVLLYGAYEEEGTNNIAELNALHQALTIASQTSSENIISIFSDSKYAIDCITTWAYSWKKNGWTKKGGEIKNLELVQEAHYLYEKLKNKIEIIHVKGHAGIEGNELADRMAVYTIKAKNKDFAFYSYNKIEEVLALKSY